tara:strand:- start:99 stop:1061 length:963 start_codon:yes stop_codon:yes gene_type:complete
MQCLVTGGSGFIGSAIANKLQISGHKVTSIIKKIDDNKIVKNQQFNFIELENIDKDTDWKKKLINIDCIVHCAAKTHYNHSSNDQQFRNYESLNYHSTINLAYQASKCGVKRFIYMSSIGVNGNFTKNEKKFSIFDSPNPSDNYATSKLIIEKKLQEISKNNELEIVIVRAPLVYGPSSKGNIIKFIKLIDSGIPLPLGSINNSKSFLSIDNLVDFLCLCVTHPSAANEIFLVSDDDDISLQDLILKITKYLDKNIFIFPFPIKFLYLSSKLINKSNTFEKLVNSLQIDINYTKSKLNWKPKYNFDESLKKTIEWYLKNK